MIIYYDAILFDEYRGKQIQRSVNDAVKSNETNTFARVMLQVVLTGNEWAHNRRQMANGK